MSCLASLWKLQQHKFVNASSEMGVEPLCHRHQVRDKTCSIMSHAQDESLKKICLAKAIELFMFIKLNSQTSRCWDLLCPQK